MPTMFSRASREAIGKTMIVSLACIGLASGILMPVPADATTITYDFFVTNVDGPLAGTVGVGTFSFDSSSITPGETSYWPDDSTGLLTGIDFTWNGVTYNDVGIYPSADFGSGFAGTQATSMLFDATGELINYRMGSNCSSGGCILNDPLNDWWWMGGNWQYFLMANGSMGAPVVEFQYGLAGIPGVYTGGGTFSPAAVGVPEPASLGIFGLGALLIGAFMGLHRWPIHGPE